jgi:site-specific DNA recombinase
MTTSASQTTSIPIAIYSRVSTSAQADRQISIESQIAAMRLRADARGCQVVEEYADEGFSGTTDKRPDLQRLMREVLSGEVHVAEVWVHSYSRFFRDAYLQEHYIRQLEEAGIKFIATAEEYGDGDLAHSMRQFSGIINGMQSRDNARHVLRTRRANAERGNYNGGIPPYGFRSVQSEITGDTVRKRLEPHPEEAELVRLIYKLRLVGDGESGPLGSKSIAEWLNVHGHRTRKGKAFYVSVIHRILTDEVCIGRYWSNRAISKTGRVRPKEEWILTPVEPLVSEEDFARVQVLLAECRPNVTPPRSVSNDVLLSGLVVCESCGGPMTTDAGKGRHGKTYHYYVCMGKKLKGKTECSYPVRISRPVLDDLVVDALCNELLVPSRMEEIIERVRELRNSMRSDRSRELTQLKAEKKQVRTEIDRLIKGIVSGALAPTPQVRAAQDDLESRLGRACALIAAKEKAEEADVRKLRPSELQERCSMLQVRLRRSAIQMQKRYVRAFVSKVTVGRDGVRLEGSGTASAELACSKKSAGVGGVQPFVRDWRRGWDSNPRYGFPHTAFRVRRIRPLCHLSAKGLNAGRRASGRPEGGAVRPAVTLCQAASRSHR